MWGSRPHTPLTPQETQQAAGCRERVGPSIIIVLSEIHTYMSEGEPKQWCTDAALKAFTIGALIIDRSKKLEVPAHLELVYRVTSDKAENAEAFGGGKKPRKIPALNKKPYVSFLPDDKPQTLSFAVPLLHVHEKDNDANSTVTHVILLEKLKPTQSLTKRGLSFELCTESIYVGKSTCGHKLYLVPKENGSAGSSSADHELQQQAPAQPQASMLQHFPAVREPSNKRKR